MAGVQKSAAVGGAPRDRGVGAEEQYVEGRDCEAVTIAHAAHVARVVRLCLVLDNRMDAET